MPRKCSTDLSWLLLAPLKLMLVIPSVTYKTLLFAWAAPYWFPLLYAWGLLAVCTPQVVGVLSAVAWYYPKYQAQYLLCSILCLKENYIRIVTGYNICHCFCLFKSEINNPLACKTQPCLLYNLTFYTPRYTVKRSSCTSVTGELFKNVSHGAFPFIVLYDYQPLRWPLKENRWGHVGMVTEQNICTAVKTKGSCPYSTMEINLKPVFA